MTRALRIVICVGGVVGCMSGGPVLAASMHPEHPDHDERKAPLAEPSVNEVKIEVREGFRYITSNGIPNHETGQFPGRGNPNTIGPQKYNFRVPVKPTPSEKPLSIGSTRGGGGPPMLPGVALNGVVFDPGTAEWWKNDRSSGWNYDALSGRINLGVDSSHAHVQPNGAYHYHGVPVGLVDKLLGDKKKGESMVQVGWAADGYPMYAVWGYEKAGDAKSAVRELKSSYRLKAGERPAGEKGPGGKYDGTYVQDFEYAAGSGDLDECNGRTGPTPEFPEGTYYYVITNQFPFVPRMLHGVADESFKRKGPPGGGRGGPRGGGPGGGGPGGPQENRGERPPPRGQ
jgi:hypothetical protein